MKVNQNIVLYFKKVNKNEYSEAQVGNNLNKYILNLKKN